MSCNNVLIVFLLLLCTASARAQEEPSSFEINGYVKFLNTTTLSDVFEGALLDNLVHNRLNSKWYINSKWTLTSELRNRLFWGDTYQLNPFFEAQLKEGGTDYLDLSFTYLKSDNFIAHTALDRVYLEFSDEQWNIRVGRQRINWGINLIWNPNDVFNAFNFVDFDYEERPGSDAIRIQYNYGYASGFELVFNPSKVSNQQTIAGLWKTNKWNYDIQLLAGKVDRDIVYGAGWAGNIGLWGFKGELIFTSNLDAAPNTFSGTLGLDYAFENGTYLNIGYLYNDQGEGSFAALFDTQLSYKNLFPAQHSIFNQWLFQVSPLINTGASVIFSPGGDNLLFFNPVCTASISQNIDFDLIGQIVFIDQNDKYDSPLQSINVRFKYSF